jgi:hypothetical protein
MLYDIAFFNFKTKDGNSAFIYAAIMLNWKVVELLLSKGANTDAKDKNVPFHNFFDITTYVCIIIIKCLVCFKLTSLLLYSIRLFLCLGWNNCLDESFCDW